MDNLKHIGGGVTKDATNVSHAQSKLSHWSLCQYSREINIEGCPGLSSVIPSHAAGQMQKLQQLIVIECDAMKEVFETGTIPRPTNSIHVHKLPNLKSMYIIGCNHLKYIFTFSTLESLKTLETLTITDCEEVKVIVREEYEQSTMTSSKDMNIIFPNLKSIKLDGLTNLEGFFLGMNIDFQWPLLDYVMISDCPQMMMFTSGQSTTPRLKNIYTKHGKHNLECCINFHITTTLQQTPPPSSDRRHWSFHNLIECNLDVYYDDTKFFPSNELQHLQNLETIIAWHCRNVEEVFEVSLEVTNNESQTVVKFPNLREVHLVCLTNLKYIWKSNQWRILEFPNLTTLSINVCERLEHVFTSSMVGCVMQLQKLHIEYCEKMKVVVKEEEEVELEVTNNESQTVVKFPNLREVDLKFMISLEYIWKSNQWRILEFPNLTRLSMIGCKRLEHVFTSSMVGCVMQLQELHIQDCENMKVVVKEEEEDCDAKVSEIKFPCLKSLKLKKLSSLEGFWLGKPEDIITLPSLDTLVIKKCPEITVFTEGRSITPELRVIKTGFGSFNVNVNAGEEDINTFIMTKKQEGYEFGVC